MMSGSAGSKASTMASATELTRLTQRICKGVIGSVRPRSSAKTMAKDSPPLIGNRKVTDLRRLS